MIQATVDFRGIFTSYDFGWPGCVQDSRVFKESHLWRYREQYFKAHEYILVDKGAIWYFRNVSKIRVSLII